MFHMTKLNYSQAAGRLLARATQLTSLALCTLMLGAPSFAKQGDTQPQHDDTGTYVPVPQGTDNAACASGVSSGFPCKNVELLARMPLDDIGGGSGADSWGWKDPQSGRYYALVARSSGTSFIDVTDPASPVYLGNLPTTSVSTPPSAASRIL